MSSNQDLNNNMTDENLEIKLDSDEVNLILFDNDEF